MRLYHGTTDQAAKAILRHGFDFDAPRRSDPGDLGWGVYLTSSRVRAACYGGAVLRVEVSTLRLATIANPYFLKGLDNVAPVTPAERLFFNIAFHPETYQMRTVTGADRGAIARRIRTAFLLAGFHGILGGTRDGDVDAALFVPDPILLVKA